MSASTPNRPDAVLRVEIYAQEWPAGCRSQMSSEQVEAVTTEVLRRVVDRLDGRPAEDRSSVPWIERAIGAEEVGELLGLAPRTVLETVACRPDFPRRLSMRPATWVAKEVLEWRQNHRVG